LTSAAIIDDVIGLVMIQIVSSLGRNGGTISGGVVGRPIGASVGLLLVVIAFSWGVLRPLCPWILKQADSIKSRRLRNQSRNLMVQMVILLVLVASGAYAGTSALFAAFLAGAGRSWWDNVATYREASGVKEPEWVGLKIYGTYCKPAVERILKPFFFV
jgi:Kef-type K+ transport system membrane component KefB